MTWLNNLHGFELYMMLEDRDGNIIRFAEVESEQHARELWCKLASGLGSYLAGFQVQDFRGDTPKTLYKGDYGTDEC